MSKKLKNGLPVHKGAGVYAIVNLKNGKVYVGSSLAVRGRLLAHRSYLRRGVHDNQILQRAWDKYGERAFRFDLLQRCGPEATAAREQRWMRRLNSTDRRYGYNICLFAGAGAMKGRKHTAESRAKMSENRKGKGDWLTGVLAAAEANRGRRCTRSEETKAKLRLAAQRRWANPEYRAKQTTNHWTKNPANAEAVERMRKKLTGRKLSAEHRRKISEGGVRGWENYRRRVAADRN